MTETVVDEVTRLAISRKKIYTLLSLVYKDEANDELLQSLRREEWKLPAVEGELKGGYAILQKFLERSKDKRVIEDLAVDFAGLFLGHGSNPAHPYESVYLDKEKVVMQEPRDKVVRIYAEEGLQRAEELNEPEDHIAIELEFMAHLCQKIIDTLAAGDTNGAIKTLEGQKKFLENHLGAWVPSFCDDVQRSAELDYYKAMAKITRRFITIDSNNINSSLISLIRQKGKGGRKKKG